MNKRLGRPASFFGVEGLEARRLLSGGVPDFGFGTDGRIVRDNEYAQVGGVMELPDGDYLIAGSTRGTNPTAEPIPFLERINPDGSTDTSYGSNGRVWLTELGNNKEIYQFVELPSGKFLLSVVTPNESSSLVRLNADGTIDSTFGVGGFSEYGAFSAMQSDGKLILTGRHKVWRLTADGLLDTTFGTNGMASFGTNFGLDSNWSRGSAVIVDPDDRIVLAAGVRILPSGGSSYEHHAGIVRLEASGVVDTTWGEDGFQSVNYYGDEHFSVASMVRSDAGHYYVLMNQDDGEHLLTRFSADGVPDTGWGPGKGWQPGVFLSKVDRFGNTAELGSLSIMPDGKILVGGSGVRENYVDLPLVIRLNADGTKDLTWGTGGDGRVFGDLIGSFLPTTVDSSGMLFSISSRYVRLPTGDPDNPELLARQIVMLRYQLTTQVQPVVSVSAGGTLTVVGTSGTDVISSMLQTPYNTSVITVTRNGTSIDVPGNSVRRAWIDAGDGDDVVENWLEFATILGGAGNDRISAFTPSYIEGQAGNDTIYGSYGYDYIVGGDGNDRIFGGAGHDVIEGGNGNDYLYGDLGNDTISGGNGRDHIWGAGGHDLLAGNGGNDMLFGENGNDTLAGLAGNDTLWGGAGNNELYGHGGNDFFYAQNGLVDSLFGGSGTDSAGIDDELDVLASIEVIL